MIVLYQTYTLLALFCVFQCRDFVKAGAEQGLTPSDVILAADITFSCVADPQAAKDVMFFVLGRI
jgi:3-hydroxyisobutyrate dehydrogenase-like beta-hydroxyacid dehydrogenase